jgi:hypothetical protein
MFAEDCECRSIVRVLYYLCIGGGVVASLTLAAVIVAVFFAKKRSKPQFLITGQCYNSAITPGFNLQPLGDVLPV